MDVGPARQLRSPLVFQVGAEPHFPRLERFPTNSTICNNTRKYFFLCVFYDILVLLSNHLGWSGCTTDLAKTKGIQWNQLATKDLVGFLAGWCHIGGHTISLFSWQAGHSGNSTARSVSVEGSHFAHAFSPLWPWLFCWWPFCKAWGNWGQKLADVY